jgi:cell division protein FtsA
MVALRASIRGLGDRVWQRTRGPLRVFAKLAVLVACVIGTIAVGRLIERHVRTSPAFAIRTITFAGHEQLEETELLEASGLSVGQNVFEKGVVVNIESTQQSIREAVDKASMMAGVQIATVFSGIAGSHLRGVNSHGIVSIANHECSREDVDRVLDQARRISMPLDRTVIHVLPQDFVIDQQDGVREPVGMSGVRIEARVHLVTAAVTSVQNVTKCIERCNLHVTELVLTPLASAEAVLTDDEKEIGVALVDIGGGTTDVVVYSEGSLRHTAVLPIGGENLTNDIAAGLRTPASEAERIKVRYGCAMRSMVDPRRPSRSPGWAGGRPARCRATSWPPSPSRGWRSSSSASRRRCTTAG